MTEAEIHAMSDAGDQLRTIAEQVPEESPVRQSLDKIAAEFKSFTGTATSQS